MAASPPSSARRIERDRHDLETEQHEERRVLNLVDHFPESVTTVVVDALFGLMAVEVAQGDACHHSLERGGKRIAGTQPKQRDGEEMLPDGVNGAC